MDRYKVYFLDLDGTLCDVDSAIETGNKKIAEIIGQHGIEFIDFMDKFQIKRKELLHQFELGNLSEIEFRIRRYQDVLTQYKCDNVRELSCNLNDIFTAETTKNIKLYPDVVPFLNNLLDNGKKIAIITNGQSERQRNKIKFSGLANYTDKLFISDEIGFAKPAKQIFEKALSEMNVSADDVVMIGDSLKSDVLGATALGIDAILINRYNKASDYTGKVISSLAEL